LKSHDVLDGLVAAYLDANPHKRPSSTTVLELIEWSAAQPTAIELQTTSVAETTPAAEGHRCERCGKFLSATRIEMRIRRCGGCDGHGARRRP
jgi:hypothetical protein